MASITPIIATQDTQQLVNAGDGEVSVSCSTSALANGVDYLVLYRGNHGGSDTSAVSRMRIRFGSSLLSGTELGDSEGEGRGLDNHWDTGQCLGVTKVTGDGSKILGFTGECITGGNDDAFFGAMTIIAIPLTDLSDAVISSFTDSASAELTDASTTVLEDVRNVSLNIPAAGDYLVIMSVEVFGMATEGSTRHRAHFEADGTHLCPDTSQHYREELEDTADRFNAMVIRKMTFGSSGNKTFKIQGQSDNNAEADFGRSRIFLLPLDQFDQVVTNIDSDGIATTATTYGTDAMCNQSYTPNQDENVLIVASSSQSTNVSNVCNSRLRNTSDSISYNEDAGEYQNQSSGDSVPLLLLAAPSLTAAGGSKTFEVQVRTQSGTGTYQRTELNMISLTTVAAQTFVPPPVTNIRRAA